MPPPPKQSLRIVVADDDEGIQMLDRLLPTLGHEVVGRAHNGHELIDVCGAVKPDLVITDANMSDMDGVTAAKEIYRRHGVPIILIAGIPEEHFIQHVEWKTIIYYLRKPIELQGIEAAITFALSRFREFQTLAEENIRLRQLREDERAIEEARVLVMEWHGLTGAEAIQLMKEVGSEKQMKLRATADAILLGGEVRDRAARIVSAKAADADTS